MTLAWTGTGGLFTRIGLAGKSLADVNAFQANTLPTDLYAIFDQFESNDQPIIDGISSQLQSAQQSAGGLTSYLQSLATNTINAMVYDDNPLLSNTDISLSMIEVIRQMKASSQTVLQMTVGSSITPYASNQGNGVAVCTTLNGLGLSQECLLPEKITLAVSQDSTSNVTPGNEQFNVTGTVSEPDPLSFDWPLGSQAQTSLTAVNASLGTLLTNGDFENWTSNTPQGFTITVGTAGTQVLKSTAQHFTGLASCEFVGDSTTLTALTQPVSLNNLTLYALNGWIKVSATPAAGVLEFALVDGTGTVINDQAGNPNLFTHSLTGVSTTFIPVSGVFRLPYITPSTIKLRVRLSTALSTGSDLFLDQLALGSMTQLYQGGPSFAVFSGSTNFYIPDYFTATVTNSFGSGATLSTFQILFQRFFNMTGLGLQLPSSLTPTISDSLI